ncbi:hypothetical protein QT20_00045 [Staphylococcus aureus]|nr:hypothetical protein QT20_00045 [Staphylococcus aureus]
MDKPFKKLTERQRDILLDGSGDKEIEFPFTQRQGVTRNRTMVFEGVVPNISRRFHESPSEYSEGDSWNRLLILGTTPSKTIVRFLVTP